MPEDTYGDGVVLAVMQTVIVYGCPGCGRTVRSRQPYYCTPATTCHHGNVVYVMKEILRIPVYE